MAKRTDTDAAGDAAKSETVTEYVLHRGEYGDADKQPLFSDSDLDLVKLHRLDEIRRAQAHGQARPVLSIHKRVCTYPLHPKTGERQAIGSTCEDSEVTL